MPTITNYQVEVPMLGLVDYVSVQYAEDFAVSMTKEQYEKELAEQVEHSMLKSTYDEQQAQQLGGN